MQVVELVCSGMHGHAKQLTPSRRRVAEDSTVHTEGWELAMSRLTRPLQGGNPFF
jgi:hypothetical protein